MVIGNNKLKIFFFCSCFEGVKKKKKITGTAERQDIAYNSYKKSR